MIRAQHLIVIDNDGKERGSLGVSGFGPGTELRLRADRDEKDSIALIAFRGGRSLSLQGEGGQVSLGTTFMVIDAGHPGHLDVGATGPHVSLFDKDGHVRVVLGAQAIRPTSPLVLVGPDGTIVWKAP